MSETPNDVLVTTMQPESILPFQCEVCSISCPDKDVLEQHKQGKKHLKSVKKLADSSADTQKMKSLPVGSEPLVEELKNKKHRLIENGATAETLIYCDICYVVCNNQEVFQKHMAGKKHSAKSIIQLARTNAVFDATLDSSGSPQKKPDTFQCEICKITCTSKELLKAHLVGKKHLKKVKDSAQIPNMPLTLVASQGTPPYRTMVNPESNEGKTVGLPEARLMCELCGIGCDTNEMLKIHMSGKKHLKKMKDSGQILNLRLTPIASLDVPSTKPPESNEGKTVSLHEAKLVCGICGISCNTNGMLKIHMSGKKHRKNLEKSEKLIGPNLATAEPVATPMVIGPLQEEVKTVSSKGSKKKNKRDGVDENLEAKKQKVLQSGTASYAVQTCKLCNVVCNSPKVFISHLAGQKHAAMAVKQTETQAIATGNEC